MKRICITTLVLMMSISSTYGDSEIKFLKLEWLTKHDYFYSFMIGKIFKRYFDMNSITEYYSGVFFDRDSIVYPSFFEGNLYNVKINMKPKSSFTREDFDLVLGSLIEKYGEPSKSNTDDLVFIWENKKNEKITYKWGYHFTLLYQDGFLSQRIEDLIKSIEILNSEKNNIEIGNDL